jgi:hypothetical protein
MTALQRLRLIWRYHFGIWRYQRLFGKLGKPPF